jgi:hypothetical protein
MSPHRLALTLITFAAATVPADAQADAKKNDQPPVWVEPMRQVHARFKGERGTFALFGDSITISLAFWAPLAAPPADLPRPMAMAQAHALVKRHMKLDCWNKWRGPEFGNQGGMTIRWADDNVAAWLTRLNPEAAVMMFGTNDIGQVPLKEYEAKMRTVVERCLQNGTVVILTTIPPRSGHFEESRNYAAAVRKIAKEKQVPLIDYFEEIVRRRPDDWDGTLPKFKNEETEKDVYQAPTLISRDGVHPSYPSKHRDYSEESLRTSGFSLRNYLTLMKYAEVIRWVLDAGKTK